MQKAHFRLTRKVLQKEVSCERLVIYKQLEREKERERERERERDYFIGDFKHYLPLTCKIFGSKRKTALDGQ